MQIVFDTSLVNDMNINNEYNMNLYTSNEGPRSKQTWQHGTGSGETRNWST